MISLIPDTPPESLYLFCEANRIELIHIPVAKPKDNLTLTSSRVMQCLSLLINCDKLPIYVHCLDGTVVTGIVIVCLRKLQTWVLPIATMEYLRFIRDGLIGSEEQEFVESFNPGMCDYLRKYTDSLPFFQNSRCPMIAFLNGSGMVARSTLQSIPLSD